MNTRDIQNLIDRLTYNQLYAPKYPEEDRITLDSEILRTNKIFEVLIRTSKERNTKWIELAQVSAQKAFDQIKTDNNDSVASSADFEFAIQYLRNAIKRKPVKTDFIVGDRGYIHKVDKL